MSKVLVIIPFYKNPHLVFKMARALAGLADEIKDQFEFIAINDSPDDRSLSAALVELATQLRNTFNITILTNPRNLGFVKSCNIGLESAKKNGQHALLLNSDTVPFPGSFSEMLRILKMDPMIGFVNPRSNDATICSLPTQAFVNRILDPESSHTLYSKIASRLPELTYSPTGVGFCFLIRHEILIEFGLLDEAFGLGYNEENDLIARANRGGYRVALANRAFVYHETSSSFGDKAKAQLENTNSKILNKRYPEYKTSIDTYFHSSGHQHERLLSSWVTLTKLGTLKRIAVDCTQMSPIHNGTYRATYFFIKALVQEKPGWSVSILCSQEVAKFQGFHDIEHIEIVTDFSASGFDVLIKVGQPFSFTEIENASNRALAIVYFMLDVIALDCNYIRHPGLGEIWNFISKYADGILFISDFSESNFFRHFPRDQNVPTTICPLSLNPKEYSLNCDPINSSENSLSLDILSQPHKSFLVVGNHFEHKHLRVTAQYLSKIKEERFVFLGASSNEISFDNITSIPSGLLSSDQISYLYKQSKGLIYPSLYEGFGIPILEGLAHGLTVFVRDNPLNDELVKKIPLEYRRRLVLYKNSETLVDLIRDFPVGSPTNSEQPKLHPHEWDWKSAGRKLGEFLEIVIEKTTDGKSARKRFDEFAFANAYLNEKSISITAEANAYRSLMSSTMIRLAVRLAISSRSALNHFPRLKRLLYVTAILPTRKVKNIFFRLKPKLS